MFLMSTRRGRLVVVIAAIVLLVTPSARGAEYIKAVNYFGKSWPLAFWNSDLSNVEADFQAIRRDGFNSIILIVPWGEFQPGLTPVRFNEDAFQRLSSVCGQAASAGLHVLMRVSFNADYYPNVELPFAERANTLMTQNALVPAWEQYLAKLSSATQTCAQRAFVSWEDFWFVIAGAKALKAVQERADYSKQSGYHEWVRQNSDSLYRFRHAPGLQRYGVYPVPRPDNPDFEWFLRYFDDRLMHHVLPILARHFPEASVEARVDGDPVYDGTDLLKWYEHTDQYRVPSSDFLMTYWSPGIGAANQGEEESSQAVLARFNYNHRNLLSKTRNQIFIDQWLFQDNTPQFRRNARIRPAELSRFIRDSARSLLQFTSGYALWNWRDYRASILFNGFFSLGRLGWEFSSGADIETISGAPYARISRGQSIHQKIPRERNHFIGYGGSLHLRFTARGEGRLRIAVAESSQEIQIQNASDDRIVSMTFSAPHDLDPNLNISAVSGSVRLSDLYLWNFEQMLQVRSSDNQPAKLYADIVELNRRLADPKTLVSSVRASDDSIQYLVGGYGPEADGSIQYSWVGPYAWVKLYAPGPSITVRGKMNLEMFQEAGLFADGCTLTAWINGEQAATMLYTQTLPIAMRVPVPDDGRGAILLELRTNCSIVPSMVGVGHDLRDLSYTVTEIRAETTER